MNEALRIAVNAADDKKANDLVILDISKVTSFANYFLLCTGDSSRQMQAIADEVEKKLKEAGIRPSHVEGYQNSEWILLDCMDLVVHIFSKNARAFYDLERLWRDAIKMDVSLLIEKKTVKPGRRKTMKPS
ncbi:MAG: Iojap-related protein [Acidobacteria bacterium]|jgi:ribosome-associated protein|nr:Iojap-related protein [Acidobacteriota bacterium]